MRVTAGAAVALCMAVLAGCAGGERAEVARRAQVSLVGMPKPMLLSCAGVPTRQATAAGNEYFTYVVPPTYGGGPSTSIGVGGGSSGNVGVGVGLGFPLFGGGGTGGCEATVTVAGGVVQRVVYSAGSHLPACAAALGNCVAP